MARPTRTNAEYFYHPASFRNDRRVKAIRARYGACGYGLLLMLIELLADADNTALPTDEMEIELLAGDLSATVEDVTNLIKAAEKVGLFARSDAGLLKCPQLDEWLAPVFDKRNRSRNTATTPNLSQPVTETPITVTETPPVKESTVQYSTVQDKTKEQQASSAGEADFASQVEDLQPESPTPAQRPTPSRPKSFRYDNAPVFIATEFFNYLRAQGYGHVDMGMYLVRITDKIKNTLADPQQRKMKQEATNDEWKAFILRWLDGDKANKRLLLPDDPPRPGYGGPNPALQVVTTSTSYSREAIAARNVTKY